METLRNELGEANVDINVGASLTELEEMHETYVTKGTLKVHSSYVDKIKFPMFPSEALNNEEVIKSVMTFDFRNGGRFIVSDCLSVFHIVKITILLATLVTFGEKKK